MERRLIVINGQFAARRMTGQERFAYELLREMDGMIGDYPLQMELVVPTDASNVPELRNIKTVRYGKAKGSLWEQTWLAYYLMRRGAISLNLCSIMPVMKPGAICIHDLSYKVNPQFTTTLYSKISEVWHKMQYNLAWRSSPLIFTVSDYSKKQMVEIYHVNPEKIVVIGNGWEHFRRIDEDESLKERKPELFEKPFFFSLGSLAPNKNIGWILEVAKAHPQYNFLIGGKASLKAYGTNYEEKDLPNVRFLGYISDGEVKTLMRGCRAFIFPSFFEGFGIPPLEALSVGAKIIVARASCLPEIFGDSAYYIDPNDTSVNLDELLSGTVGDGEKVLEKYRFSRFARTVLDSLLSVS